MKSYSLVISLLASLVLGDAGDFMVNAFNSNKSSPVQPVGQAAGKHVVQSGSQPAAVPIPQITTSQRALNNSISSATEDLLRMTKNIREFKNNAKELAQAASKASISPCPMTVTQTVVKTETKFIPSGPPQKNTVYVPTPNPDALPKYFFISPVNNPELYLYVPPTTEIVEGDFPFFGKIINRPCNMGNSVWTCSNGGILHIVTQMYLTAAYPVQNTNQFFYLSKCLTPNARFEVISGVLKVPALNICGGFLNETNPMAVQPIKGESAQKFLIREVTLPELLGKSSVEMKLDSFSIERADNPAKVIGLETPSQANGVYLKLIDKKEPIQKEAVFIKLGDQVKSMLSMKAMDIQQGQENSEGASIIQYQPHGGDNQKFELLKTGQIRELNTNYCMSAPDTDIIRMRICDVNDKTQIFKFTSNNFNVTTEEIENGQFNIEY